MTDPVERRSAIRMPASKGVLLFFRARPGVSTCELRDVTDAGAGIRLNGLRVLPPKFELSFDNLSTVRNCRLIWRQDDLVGIAFEN
jgi:hypothetical protein